MLWLPSESERPGASRLQSCKSTTSEISGRPEQAGQPETGAAVICETVPVSPGTSSKPYKQLKCERCLQEGVDTPDAVATLVGQGFNVHPSYITSTRLDFEARKLPQSVIRASVHYFNTEEEIGRFVEAVARLTPSSVANGSKQFTAAGLLLGSLFRSE